MTTGIVKWFNATKGYGFISLEQQDGDVYVHASGLRPADAPRLVGGQRVSFHIELSRDGRQTATNVVAI